jgi:PKD repeat protein
MGLFFLFIRLPAAILSREVITMRPSRGIAALLALAGLLLVVWGCTFLNRVPVAGFAVTLTGGGAALSIQVDASTSFDPDGDTMTYQWDFGDGTFLSGMIASHTYAAAGDYTVQLTVTDTGGETATALQTVTVGSGTSSGDAPIASFTASPSSGGTPLTVIFNASASVDPNGTIVSYAWSFGDGATGSGVSPLHTYAAEGSYNAMLTVTDNDGLKHSMTMVIVVIDGGQGGCR